MSKLFAWGVLGGVATVVAAGITMYIALIPVSAGLKCIKNVLNDEILESDKEKL